MSKEKNTSKREHPDRPIPAVGVVVFNGDKVLLIKRNKPPKSFMWSIPGGAQDLGEKLKDTAAREVKEEAGIQIKNIKLIDAVDYIEKNDNDEIKYHYSLIDYVGEYGDGELQAADDAIDAKWVDFNALEEYKLWSETIRIIHQARTILKHTK